MKKKLKLCSALLVGLMVFSMSTSTLASATTFSKEDKVVKEVQKKEDKVAKEVQKEVKNLEKQPTVEDIQSLDRFVSVENNQFIFSLPDHVEIDEATYEAVILNISMTNEEIAKNDGTIDPNTKVINTNEISIFSSGYTSQKFWWGERATYTSAQTTRAVKDTYVAAAQIGLGTLGLAAIPFLQVLAVPTGITGGYLTLLASKMDAANKGRGVILDMTKALAFTVKSR